MIDQAHHIHFNNTITVLERFCTLCQYLLKIIYNLILYHCTKNEEDVCKLFATKYIVDYCEFSIWVNQLNLIALIKLYYQMKNVVTYGKTNQLDSAEPIIYNHQCGFKNSAAFC